jgi:hypothetical protein
MGNSDRYRNGVETHFEAKIPLSQIDPKNEVTILQTFGTFLQERDIDICNIISSGLSPWVQARYKNGFYGGPSFILREDNENHTNKMFARFSAGEKNFIDFSLKMNEEDISDISITEHGFRNYPSQNIEDWFQGVINGIEKAETKNCLEWVNATTE